MSGKNKKSAAMAAMMVRNQAQSGAIKRAISGVMAAGRRRREAGGSSIGTWGGWRGEDETSNGLIGGLVRGGAEVEALRHMHTQKQ